MPDPLSPSTGRCIPPDTADRDALFAQLESASGVGACIWDGTGLWAWSDQLYRLLGIDPAAVPLSVDEYLERVLPADRSTVERALNVDFPCTGGFDLEHRVVHTDGSVRHVRIRGRTLFDRTGAFDYGLATIQDVTEQRRVAHDLVEARDFFAGVLGAATEQCIIGLDADGMVTVFNAGAEKLLAYQAGEVVGRLPVTALHDPDEVRARAVELGVPPDFPAVVGRAARGEPELRRWTYLARDGRPLVCMVSTTPMFDGDGVITGYIAVGTNLSTRVVVEQALSASAALFEEIFDHAPMGIMLMGASGPDGGRLLRVNPTLCRITGYTEAELLGLHVRDLTHRDDLGHHRVNMAAIAGGGVALHDIERRWRHADGHDIWVQASVTPVRTPVQSAGAALVVVIVEDITVRKNAEQRLSHLALHDALTGLPNRTLLLDRLENALAAAGRAGTAVAVCYLDLDGFKAVNDEAGHLVGDDILLMVADRLRTHVRPGDTVARLGGDEFVAVCPGLTTDTDADAVAERLLAVLSEPYPDGQHVHRLSASIGLAVSDRASTATTLLRAADDAMYSAKDNGRNRIHRSGAHPPATQSRTARGTRHLVIEHELRGAIERDELVMFGQPVVDLASGRTIALEMLIRWEHPTRGLLAPVHFLDIAENSALVTPIGRRVLHESCRIGVDLGRVSATGPEIGFTPDLFEPAVHVNISGRLLESGTICEDVLAALDHARLAPDRLVLELTETYAPLIAGSLMEDLAELRRRGVRLAIDDVGTGYSSLSRLTELPVDILKVDRSFVADLGRSPVADAVVGAIVNIAQSLHLEVVAEGVETADQERLLLEMGCRTVQGYRYSTPRPEAELRMLVRQSLPAGPGRG